MYKRRAQPMDFGVTLPVTDGVLGDSLIPWA